MAATPQWWEALGAEPGSTIANPDYTLHFDKVSCMKGAFFAHVTFCYLLFLSGIFAFVTRLVPALKWAHAWMGRAYIISMLWATATSLIIHNSGLPAATLISFIWVLGGLCVAWLLIKLHELRADRAAAALVQQQIAAGDSAPAKDLARALATAKASLANNKTAAQRFFSLKSAHGIIMFVSWINVAGRIFASDQSGDFTCHTYPVYKPLDTKHGNYTGGAPMTLLPTHDQKFARLPWAKTGLVGWSLALLLGPLVGAALVGAGFSFFAARAAAKRGKTTPSGVAAAHDDKQDRQLAAVEDGVLVAHGHSRHAK